METAHDVRLSTDEAAFQHVLEAGIKSAQGETVSSLRPCGGFVVTPGRVLLSAARLARIWVVSMYVSVLYLRPTKDTHIVRQGCSIIDGPVINHKNMFQSPEMRRRSRRLVTRWKMVNACKIAES